MCEIEVKYCFIYYVFGDNENICFILLFIVFLIKNKMWMVVFYIKVLDIRIKICYVIVMYKF